MNKRLASTALLLALAIFQPSTSYGRQHHQPHVTQEEVTQEEAEPNEADLDEHDHYTNKSGKTVHSPAHTISGQVPPGASAQCGDGSYSFSQHHRGTCSHHGGVAQWL